MSEKQHDCLKISPEVQKFLEKCQNCMDTHQANSVTSKDANEHNTLKVNQKQLNRISNALGRRK